MLLAVGIFNIFNDPWYLFRFLGRRDTKHFSWLSRISRTWLRTLLVKIHIPFWLAPLGKGLVTCSKVPRGGIGFGWFEAWVCWSKNGPNTCTCFGHAYLIAFFSIIKLNGQHLYAPNSFGVIVGTLIFGDITVLRGLPLCWDVITWCVIFVLLVIVGFNDSRFLFRLFVVGVNCACQTSIFFVSSALGKTRHVRFSGNSQLQLELLPGELRGAQPWNRLRSV